MLRAASLATLAVRLLLGSIAPGARHARPNASAGAAGVVALLVRCCLPLQQCGAVLLHKDHCKMGTAERGRAWARLQMLMIINVSGWLRGIVVCFLHGIYNNHFDIMTIQELHCRPTSSTSSPSRRACSTPADAARRAASDEPSTSSGRRTCAGRAAASGGRDTHCHYLPDM